MVETSFPAIRAADFLGTLGVVTHIPYTDSQWDNVDQIVAALDYLGVHKLRDVAPVPGLDAVWRGHFDAVADAGNQFVFLTNATSPDTVVAAAHGFEVKHPGSVLGIEGPNEVNNWPVSYDGATGTAGAQAFQAALYAAVKADPWLGTKPVLGFTDYPEHAGASDWINIHPYERSGSGPYDAFVAGKAAQEAADPGKPFTITETGYHTLTGLSGWYEGISETTQAKWLLASYLDGALLGSRATFLYNLLDGYPDASQSDPQAHFGLFRYDGSAKPAATAIHNLTTILADTAADAAPCELSLPDISLPDSGFTGHSLLLQKSSGAADLILWNEPDIWNETTDTPIGADSSQVSVDLGAVYSTVEIYDPLLGTAATQTLHDVQLLTIAVSDHPVIVQIVPNPARPSDRPASLSAGTGPDTLALAVSQDAYLGSAHYTVSVDGRQVGGTFTSSASHAAEQKDTLTLHGWWGTGAHTVQVNFLNDAYDGTAATDRNLYVDAVTYNGVQQPDELAGLFSSGPHVITVGSELGVAPSGAASVDDLAGPELSPMMTGTGGGGGMTGDLAPIL